MEKLNVLLTNISEIHEPLSKNLQTKNAEKKKAAGF